MKRDTSHIGAAIVFAVIVASLTATQIAEPHLKYGKGAIVAAIVIVVALVVSFVRACGIGDD